MTIEQTTVPRTPGFSIVDTLAGMSSKLNSTSTDPGYPGLIVDDEGTTISYGDRSTFYEANTLVSATEPTGLNAHTDVGTLWRDTSTNPDTYFWWDGYEWRALVPGQQRFRGGVGLEAYGPAVIAESQTFADVYLQAAAPAGVKNRVWKNSSTSVIQRYDGTAWANVDSVLSAAFNAAIAQADMSDSVMRIYYQTSAPTDPGGTGKGTLWYDIDDNFKPYTWDMVAWVTYNGDVRVAPTDSDGNPPPYSPAPEVTAAIMAYYIEWNEVPNVDPVTYKLYMSDTSPVSTVVANLVGETTLKFMWVNADPNGTPFTNTTARYFRMVASDADGAATASATVGPVTVENAVDQAALDAANAEIDVLQTVTIPNLQAELDAAELEIATLEGTMTTVQNDLNTAEAAIVQRERVLIQTTQPTGLGASDRVTWLDSDNGYAASRWNGTAWSPYQLSGGAILPGGIITSHMTANTISGDRITTGTLDADRIVALSIEAGQIASNAIITAKILAGNIVTSHMTSNTINGDRITGNTMNASKIIAGTITTDRMTANTINGDRIAANTLHANKIVAGTLIAEHINGETINAVTITGSTVTGTTVQTAASGARIVLDVANGLRAFNATTQTFLLSSSDGSVLVGPTTGTFPAQVKLGTFTNLITGTGQGAVQLISGGTGWGPANIQAYIEPSTSNGTMSTQYNSPYPNAVNGFSAYVNSSRLTLSCTFNNLSSANLYSNNATSISCVNTHVTLGTTSLEAFSDGTAALHGDTGVTISADAGNVLNMLVGTSGAWLVMRDMGTNPALGRNGAATGHLQFMGDRLRVVNSSASAFSNIEANAFVVGSDERRKENIQAAAAGALQRLRALTVYEYDICDGDGRRQLGVMAQDVAGQIPCAVVEDDEGYLGLDIYALVAECIAAIQELTNLAEAYIRP